MPAVLLDDRTVVRVAGPDAEHLLQNIITTDLDKLAEGEAKPGALLTPQGKILFDFLVSRDGPEGFRLDVRKDIAADFQRRLTLYKLRAKADISLEDQAIVSAEWETDSSGSHSDSTKLKDSRFKELRVFRVYSLTPTPKGNADAYDALRIAHAIVESGSDYELSDAFPHDALLDQMDGVGMQKGCYVGQEVVSRMHHRGTARRRVLIVEGDGDLPSHGTELTAESKALGALGTVEGARGLAIVRIDRVKDAMDAGVPIMAGDVAVRLRIPDWVRYGFPESPEQEHA